MVLPRRNCADNGTVLIINFQALAGIPDADDVIFQIMVEMLTRYALHCRTRTKCTCGRCPYRKLSADMRILTKIDQQFHK